VRELQSMYGRSSHIFAFGEAVLAVLAWDGSSGAMFDKFDKALQRCAVPHQRPLAPAGAERCLLASARKHCTHRVYSRRHCIGRSFAIRSEWRPLSFRQRRVRALKPL
jgi:hypothetical protein